ncbi:sensor histidine kinase [Chitinimonas sp. BJB300]|uniref:sensor histidine kinase n=1 Tax=Chitinimonas sp. BJB300 TaxID=1559339 RepID=UPI000C0EC9DF|nr:histidine kinase [Chitinimonas sp. BJB300]PHV11548.1 sensor histidine kinase [Chitinimonas sp. BJB300]TSJ87256.1 sensor histidine kinase [Chitinimonas sp. BJB300]
MNTDESSHNTAPGDQDVHKPAAPPDTTQTLRMMRDGAVVLWWRFFDWLAVVPWKTLLIVSLLILILGGPFGADDFIFLLIVASFIIKIVAGGKRRAELTATQATERADTEQLERTVLEARMEALQAQIEPHFLFNTLASIDQLIQTDPPRASKMQQSLIRYLRSAMPQMREGGRPSLGQQVNLSSAFLEIMAVRMEERLQPKIDVPEGLKSAVFPSMMLQTLVENAIKHGLEPKVDGGKLEINAEIVNGSLAVHVLDTGQGFMPQGSGGVGLANIRERLKVLYNGRAELIISVPPDGGTLATIKVPYEVVPANPDPIIITTEPV